MLRRLVLNLEWNHEKILCSTARESGAKTDAKGMRRRWRQQPQYKLWTLYHLRPSLPVTLSLQVEYALQQIGRCPSKHVYTVETAKSVQIGRGSEDKLLCGKAACTTVYTYTTHNQ
jgi:hypothetical protein